MSERADSFDVQAELLKAMAHPVRLRLLEELAKGEECVCHISALLDKPQPYISQQLASLKEAGLVVDRRDAQWVFYRIADPHVVELLKILRGLAGASEQPTEPRRSLAGCACPKCA